MKLLITTQKLDKSDPILGFFHEWVAEFAKHCESVHVVCLYKGEYDLPDNVRVFSLGKEERQSQIQYLIHFYWYIIHERKKYDTVFVHMNQIYVVLGGLLWRMFGKKVGLWYTHRAVEWKLRVAELLSHQIFTASKEGFNIRSKKLNIVGHGIALDKFEKRGAYSHEKFSIVSVSRVTRIKNLETLIEAVSILVKGDGKGIADGMDISCDIVGPQITPDDTLYFGELQKMVREKGVEKNITFTGGVTNEKIREYYWNSDVNINLAPTGGVDKVVLEGVAAGIIPLASNRAFAPIFGEYEKDLMFNLRDAQELAEKIKNLRSMNGVDREKMLRGLQSKVEKDYSLKVLVQKIIKILSA